MNRGIIFSLCLALAGTSGALTADTVYQREGKYSSIFGLKGYETEQIEPGLYTFRYGGVRNIFVVTDAGVIATDPIHGAAAAAMREEIARITDQPVKYVVYSHWHWDHVKGGQIFKDEGATFVSHLNCVSHFARRPHADVVMPDVTFESNYEITLGGKTLELLYFGPNHSACMVVMRLKGSKTLFVNDLITPYYSGFGSMPDYAPGGLLYTLKALEALRSERIIGGHGVPVAPASQITEQRELLEALMAGVRADLAAGKSLFEVGKEVDLSEFSHVEGIDQQRSRFMERIMFYETMGW